MATKKRAAQAAAVSTPHSVYEEGDIRRYLDDEAAAAFSAKEWAGKIVIAQLLRYAKKLGRPMSKEDVGQWSAAQEERRVKHDAEGVGLRTLLDERPDPDAAFGPCGAERHQGANPAITPGSRFLLAKGADGRLVRRTHNGGGEAIVTGDFLVTADGAVVFYCRRCREAARRDAQRGGYRLMWYTSAGAGRKIAAITAADERRERALAAEKAAAKTRMFFPSTPRGKRR